MSKGIEGASVDKMVIDEIPLLPKLKIYALQHPEIHLDCDIFTKQVCTCRYKDGGLVPDKWKDELILEGLNQQLSPHFIPNKYPYAQYTFANTLGFIDYLE